MNIVKKFMILLSLLLLAVGGVSATSTMPYWVDSDNSVWTKVSVAPNSTTNFYITRVNDSSYNPNPNQVFLLYDDFRDGINSDATISYGYNYSISPTDGLVVNEGELYIEYPAISSKIVTKYNLKITDNNDYDIFRGTPVQTNDLHTFEYNSTNWCVKRRYYDDLGTVIDTYYYFPETTFDKWHSYILAYDGENGYVSVDGNKVSFSPSVPISTTTPRIAVGQDGHPAIISIQDMIVRSCAKVEPTINIYYVDDKTYRVEVYNPNTEYLTNYQVNVELPTGFITSDAEHLEVSPVLTQITPQKTLEMIVPVFGMLGAVIVILAVGGALIIVTGGFSDGNIDSRENGNMMSVLLGLLIAMVVIVISAIILVSIGGAL